MIDYKKYKYLFLDRDGVINVERKNDYVKNVSEFIFEENALQALSLLFPHFELILIVTNQRGVGRGIMSHSDVEDIHNFMLGKINRLGVSIDKIYYCSDIESSSSNRKPNVGMGLQAKKDFPEIEFSESIMVGNSKSDIEFGHQLGMYTVLVGNKYQKGDIIYEIADAHYMNLYEFALSL